MKLDWPKLALRWKEALGKYKYVLLVIGLGVVLMALPTTGQRDKGQEGAQAPAEGFDLEAFEEKMERLTKELSELFVKSHELEAQIKERLGAIGYEV